MKQTKKVTKFKMPKSETKKIRIEEQTVPFIKHLLDLSITYNDGFTKGYEHGRKSILDMQEKVKVLNRRQKFYDVLYWIFYFVFLASVAFLTWKIMEIILTK